MRTTYLFRPCASSVDSEIKEESLSSMVITNLNAAWKDWLSRAATAKVTSLFGVVKSAAVNGSKKFLILQQKTVEEQGLFRARCCFASGAWSLGDKLTSMKSTYTYFATPEEVACTYQ